MAKGQKRSNKEVRKPKQDKKAKSSSGPAGSALPLKVMASGGFTGGKKK
jgi:hypothetical protein